MNTCKLLSLALGTLRTATLAHAADQYIGHKPTGDQP